MVCDVQQFCNYIENENIVQVVLLNIQGVPKKKDILNIHIKSEEIIIFSQKCCYIESTIFVVKC